MSRHVPFTPPDSSKEATELDFYPKLVMKDDFIKFLKRRFCRARILEYDNRAVIQVHTFPPPETWFLVRNNTPAGMKIEWGFLPFNVCWFDRFQFIPMDRSHHIKPRLRLV